jgi:hypothetical protein
MKKKKAVKKVELEKTEVCDVCGKPTTPDPDRTSRYGTTTCESCCDGLVEER